MEPVFWKAKNIILIKRRGKSTLQKLLKMVQVSVLFHTDEFIFVLSFKNGAKTSPRVSKLGSGYYDGRVPKLSFRVTLATSADGVVCHIVFDV